MHGFCVLNFFIFFFFSGLYLLSAMTVPFDFRTDSAKGFQLPHTLAHLCAGSACVCFR